jgi:UDP-N-acetylmuramoyl-L-alanyl-D-glutamate--2,6-diaminopimelate ligase
MQHDNNALLRVLDVIGFVNSEANIAELSQNDFMELSLDSRKTNRETVFIAVYGQHTSGHSFLEKAAINGCKLALLETKQKEENGKGEIMHFAEDSSLFCINVHDLANKLSDIAYSFYSKHPTSESTKLPVVTAITGTNGKTSVAALIAQLASLCHQKSASIGTLGVNEYCNGRLLKLADTINTTPDIISLISTLSRLQKQSCKQVTLEASSHGLEQNRLHNLIVSCAVFTNLTQDHLDYHHTMQAYADAKRKLLTATGLTTVILNADDKESYVWQANITGAQQLFWFSLLPLEPELMGCWSSDIVYKTSGIEFTLHARLPAFEQSALLRLKLIGAFNLANALASVTALLAQNYSFSDITSAIAQLSPVAGRMELFESAKASLVVDYAHTPDALKQALLAARIHTKGQLSCVFGCGGDRDSSKRAIMGAVAAQYADSIILTQDNSRSEDPINIIADIKKGITSITAKPQLHIELDREQAILQAWKNSNKDDMIVVAGKGHEDYIEIDKERIKYNEREVVAALASRSFVDEVNTYVKGSTL